MQIQPRTNLQIQRELGARLQAHRLNQNLSQADLAFATGLARKTITNLENGHGGTLLTLIAVLRVLGLLAQFEAFAPDPGPSPIQLLKLAGRRRRRATGRRQLGVAENPPAPWTWGPSA
jgi:transcriptional regulator with XRE-family HTH domain